MTLSLDHQHRLNLILLLGAQRGTVADIRQYGSLIDRLELNDEEKKAIRFQVVVREDGAEMFAWDRALKLPPIEVEISDAEAQRLRRILEEWPHFVIGADRGWLASLMPQLPNLDAASAQPVPARRM